MPTRRSFLLGGTAAVLGVGSGGLLAVEEGWLPGRTALARATGRCDDVDVPVPSTATGPVQSETFRSTYRRQDVTWTLGLPAVPTAGLPVVVVLHGRSGDSRTGFDALGLHRFLAAYVASGGRPFALAAIDGGTSYWHPRADGEDALGMVRHELLPRLEAAGLRVDRLGVMGWSMGGYGALLLARESAADALDGVQVVAAAASSPALFPSFAESAGGAFDDDADFDAWGDLISSPGVADGTALMVSCGELDAFTDVTRDYRAAVAPEPAGGIGAGCHDSDYWRSVAAEQIAFLGDHLAS